MHFGFVLEMSNTALWNIDLLDTHLDLFHTDIPRKYFDIFKACFQDISLRHLQDKSWRHLEDVFSVTTFCLLRGLQDVLQDVKLLLWRGVEEIFKACLEDFLETFSRPTNVCLVVFWYPDDLWNKLNLYWTWLKTLVIWNSTVQLAYTQNLSPIQVMTWLNWFLSKRIQQDMSQPGSKFFKRTKNHKSNL